MKKKALSVILLSGLLHVVSAQHPVPAQPQAKSILLTGGTAHLGNGKVIENAAIGFKNGKITFAGEASAANKNDYEEVIDAKGKHIYPGFIVPNSSLGLTEVASVRATRDFADISGLNPHVRAQIAYNTDSRVPYTLRTNGILLAQATPRGGIISGTSTVFELDGWNWEDATFQKDDGVHLNWPNMFSRSRDFDNPGKIEKSKEYDKELAELKKFFDDSKAYAQAGKPVETNVRFESMKGLFNGSQTLFLHVNYVKEIIDAVNFAKNHGIKKITIIGGSDSWMLTDLLKENNIPVILSSVHDLPDKTDDDIDQPFKLPSLLQKAGVSFCLNNDSRMEPMGARNVPFFAGTAAAYGLSKEEALTAITLSTAKILGIDNRVGSLELGKDATLFISSGDALDMRTNNVELAFIRGKNLDLRNEQKELYERYSKKYGIQQRVAGSE